MMLQHVLQSAIDGHLLTPARVGPMRTAVKQFSAMFGLIPEQLGPEQYHLPKDALFRFIEQHSPPDVGPSKLRNTKNNIRWLLDLAVRKRWLNPTAGTSRTWETRHLTTDHTALHRIRADDSHANFDRYGLLDPAPLPDTRLQRYQLQQRQGLQVAPQAFLDEINAYLSWCQQPYAPGRSAKVHKREVTADKQRRVLLSIGGYAHHIAGIPLAEITLERLTRPEVVQVFVDWWVNTRRGRVTQTIKDYVRSLQVVARHWLKDETGADALKVLDESLSNDRGPVWDKEASLVPLRSIEEAGLRSYPFSVARLQRSKDLRRIYNHVRNPDYVPSPATWESDRRRHGTGSQVMISLIIRLLVRLPMRQRCIREMRLGHNLRQLKDDSWEVYFRGTELKIGSRKQTGINVYHHPIPADLTALIDEWLNVWRPQRLPEKGSNLVFLTEFGRPFRGPTLNTLFIRAVYRITGIRTTIHMVRDSWASEYLDATGDVAGCADMLGDTVQMVLKHYAHVLKRRAQGRTANWLQTHLEHAG